MKKVYLFGSSILSNIPNTVVEHISNIIKQTNGDVEFLIGDNNSSDTAFHKALSSIGATEKGTIICYDYPKNNKYGLKARPISSEGVDVKDKYSAKDRLIADECDFAIAIYDGSSKRTFDIINKLKIRNKYVFVYTIKVD